MKSIPITIFRSVRAEEIERILRSYHFWAIALILSAIAVFYYRYSYPAIIFTNDFSSRLWQLWVFEFKSNMHGALFVIPMLYATIKFGWHGTLVAWGSCMIVAFPYLLNWNSGWINRLTNIVFLSVPFLMFGFITLNLRYVQRVKRMTEEREAERRAYMSQVFKAQENERQRIAYELHDGHICKECCYLAPMRSWARPASPSFFCFGLILASSKALGTSRTEIFVHNI